MLEHAVWAKQQSGNESFKVRGYLKVPRKAHFLLPLSRTLSRVILLAKSLPSAVNRCFCYVNEAITSSPQERLCWATFTSTSDSLCPKSWYSPCRIFSTWVWSRRRSPRCRFRPVVLTLHVRTCNVQRYCMAKMIDIWVLHLCGRAIHILTSSTFSQWNKAKGQQCCRCHQFWNKQTVWEL